MCTSKQSGSLHNLSGLSNDKAHLLLQVYFSHLTGVLSSQNRASTDHVICDPEVVVVPAVGEDVHIHRPQHGRQAVAVEPGHPPAADRAPCELGQRRGVLLRQRRRLHPGVDDSRTVQLSRRGNICRTVSQSTSAALYIIYLSTAHFQYEWAEEG